MSWCQEQFPIRTGTNLEHLLRVIIAYWHPCLGRLQLFQSNVRRIETDLQKHNLSVSPFPLFSSTSHYSHCQPPTATANPQKPWPPSCPRANEAASLVQQTPPMISWGTADGALVLHLTAPMTSEPSAGRERPLPHQRAMHWPRPPPHPRPLRRYSSLVYRWCEELELEHLICRGPGAID